jgi:cell division septation protein DedD
MMLCHQPGDLAERGVAAAAVDAAMHAVADLDVAKLDAHASKVHATTATKHPVGSSASRRETTEHLTARRADSVISANG